MTTNIKIFIILIISCILSMHVVSAYDLSTIYNGVVTYEEDGSFVEKGTVIELLTLKGELRNFGVIGVDGKYEFQSEGNLGEYMVFYVNGIQIGEPFPMETGGIKTTDLIIPKSENVTSQYIIEKEKNISENDNNTINTIETPTDVIPTVYIAPTPTENINNESKDNFDIFNPTGVNVDTIYGIPSTLIIIITTIISAFIGYSLYLYMNKKIYREEEIVTIKRRK